MKVSQCSKSAASALVAVCLIATNAGVAVAAPGGLEDAVARFLEGHPQATFKLDESQSRVFIAQGFRAPLSGEVEVATRRFVLDRSALFGLAAPGTDIVYRDAVNHRSDRYLRFDQEVDGLPVWGAGLTAHVSRAGDLVRVSSKTAPGAPNAWTPVLDGLQAFEAAAEGIPLTARGGPVELGYFPVQGRLLLAYRVIVFAEGPHHFETFVNASTGGVLYRHDLIRRHDAMLYEQNPVVTPDLTKVTLENIVADGEHANHAYGAYARVASCPSLAGMGGCEEMRFDAVANATNGFLDVEPVLTNNPIVGDGFAELMVYNAIDKQHQWYIEEFGFYGMWLDSGVFLESGELQGSEVLWVFVNADFQNGYFSGGTNYPGYESPAAIVLGNIYDRDLAYDNDVVLHEFQHAVSSVAFSLGMGGLDELGIDMTAMAIEEGNADYFACTTQDNSTLGEYSQVKRDLDNENTCPASLMGESHHDGQIAAGALWDIREELGKRKTDHLVYGAMTSGAEIATFADFALAVISQAEWMADSSAGIEPALQLTQADVDVVEEMFDARNMFDCRRLVPMKDGDAPLIHLMQFAFGPEGMPSAVQYMVETDEHTESFTFEIGAMGTPDFDVYVRQDEPILFEWEESGGGMYGGYTWTAEYDYEWLFDQDEWEPIGAVEFSADSEVPLAPGSTYYFSIICRPEMYSGIHCQNMVSISMESSEPDPIEDAGEPESDAGPEDDADAGDGPETGPRDAGVDAGDASGGSSDDCDCRASLGARRGAGLIGRLAHLL